MFLQNAIQNNETLIKSMQEQVDKSELIVTSMYDHEISFLNDTIANIWAAVGIGIGIITLVFSGIGLYIGYSNRKSQEKMEVAERAIGEAKDIMDNFSREKAELEAYRRETEEEFKRLTELVNSDKIKDLYRKADVLSTTRDTQYATQLVDYLIELSYTYFETIKDMEISIDMIERYEKYKVLLNNLKEYPIFPVSDLKRGTFIWLHASSLVRDFKELIEEMINLLDEHSIPCHNRQNMRAICEVIDKYLENMGAPTHSSLRETTTVS